MTTPETLPVTPPAPSTLACPLLLKTMYTKRPDVFRTGTMPSAPSFTLEQWAARLPVAAELARG